jgi:YVTN family beta-propeller protein
MKKLLIPVLLLSIAVSCTKISNPPPTDSYSTGNGVFILNEGNFMGGNGSLSFYSYDSAEISNDLFYKKNGRPLGDVPNSLEILGDKLYIVVNNSGKIEVINISTFESVSTINGLNSPRNISFINNEKAYVTSIYSDSLTILNLTDNKISGYINIRRSSEAIVVSGEKAFVANWMGGNEVMVINTGNNKLVDSIKVGIEPESMVMDENGTLWVLCNGGWKRDNFAELVGINSITNKVEKRLVFPSKTESPSCLTINGDGETLYFLENGVRKMSIYDSVVPSVVYIAESGHYFYKLGVNPVNNDIFVTDALDYQKRGYVIYYKKDGTLVSTQIADIIPGMMAFKLNGNIQIK